jgi:hypothetical protein
MKCSIDAHRKHTHARSNYRITKGFFAGKKWQRNIYRLPAGSSRSLRSSYKKPIPLQTIRCLFGCVDHWGD